MNFASAEHLTFIVWRVVMKSHTLNMENIIVNKREREKLNFHPVGAKRNNNSCRDILSVAVVFRRGILV